MKHPLSDIIISLSLCLLLLLANLTLTESSPQCKAWLVQSIPTDMPHLSPVPGVLTTGDVLLWLAKNSTKSLDVIAQYWQLVASPADPRSGDYGYSKEEMKRFGVDQGSAVYNAIEDAALRNVSIRLLQHSGVYPDFTKEPTDLASGRPNVKEVGIYLVDCPKIAKSVETYFGNLWKLASLNSSAYTRTVSDQQWQVNRTVPCWSHFIDSKERCRDSRFASFSVMHLCDNAWTASITSSSFHEGSPYYRLSNIIRPIYVPYSNRKLPGTVIQICGLNQAIYPLLLLRFQADEQAWVDTIKSVGTGSTVRINTMDWLGQSQYVKPTVYWSSLSSVISEVVFSKHATVKLLVAFWAHFIDNTEQYLKSLLYSNVLCSSSKYNNCSGKVEIMYYLVPGYNLTGPAISNGTSTGNIYPGFTRVNHGKYAVSDTRAHIGTSNLIWDYFYTTAGVSFGTYNPAIVSQLQAIFDADWNSPYAIPVGELDEAHRSYSSSTFS
ncbi:hypothetical protein NC652_039092 [Populus alba x Populus x berolinensis]|nr:hypothetical protein NC652_039092 [Populus alba x Populus x berolinensis]